MKIRHATALLPLILLVGCALNGENQIRKLDLKGLCTKEQIFSMKILVGEWIPKKLLIKVL